jgi:hypothetical protein
VQSKHTSFDKRQSREQNDEQTLWVSHFNNDIKKKNFSFEGEVKSKYDDNVYELF